MLDHRDAIHGTASELIILLGQLVILILKLLDVIFKSCNLTQVGLDRLSNLPLELASASLSELRPGVHLRTHLILHTE